MELTTQAVTRLTVTQSAEDDPKFQVRRSSLVRASATWSCSFLIAFAPRPFTFSAELLYEPLSYRFVQDLLTDKTPLTERCDGYYGEMDKVPLRVAALDPVKTK